MLERSGPPSLDVEEVKRAAAPFGQSRNLPRDAYVAREVLAWELHRFFRGGWMCVGRTDDLAQPGDQKAVRIGNEGILLTVAEDGRIHGFFNVCRHRAHELLKPGACFHAAVIRCPYHAWTYALDGRLKSAPRIGEVSGFDPAEHGLTPLRIEVWHGWVFANISGDAAPFRQWVDDLGPLVRDHEPERLVIDAAKTYEVAANWKLVHENFHECYHCPQIHPELCQITPHESGQNFNPKGCWVGGRMELKPGVTTMSLDGRSDGLALRRLKGDQLRRVDYYGLLPNLFISLHPDYVLTHRLEPMAVDRTKIECHWLFSPEAMEKPGFSPDYAFDFWDLTNLQDWAALESVQRGISSSGYRPGPLARREDAVHHFVERIARGYLEGRLAGVAG